MALILKLNSNVWDLVESSRQNRRKDISSVIKNIQKLMYNFSILKVNRLYERICELMRCLQL